MGKKILAVLQGMAKTMEISPSGRPRVALQDRTARLRRPWERTGKSLQRAAEIFAREQKIA